MKVTFELDNIGDVADLVQNAYQGNACKQALRELMVLIRTKIHNEEEHYIKCSGICALMDIAMAGRRIIEGKGLFLGNFDPIEVKDEN